MSHQAYIQQQQQDAEQPLMKLWALIQDLSEQLTQNKIQTAELQQKVREVKGQAVHTNSGFALRRFNTDISQEEFNSLLEKESTKLTLENQQLLNENKQLSLLLREYENTLESVMGKFRSMAHANQTHTLALQQYYTTTLTNLLHNQSESTLSNESRLSSLLTRLSQLLRNALREGEPLRDETLDGEIGLQGGYTGQGGLERDWALEREIEIERLEAENKGLRELLNLPRQIDEINGSSMGRDGSMDSDGNAGAAWDQMSESYRNSLLHQQHQQHLHQQQQQQHLNNSLIPSITTSAASSVTPAGSATNGLALSRMGASSAPSISVYPSSTSPQPPATQRPPSGFDPITPSPPPPPGQSNEPAKSPLEGYEASSSGEGLGLGLGLGV